MFKELKKRNFKVDLPLMLRTIIKKELGFDIVHTISDVVRLDLGLLEDGRYEKYVMAAYDITGSYTGLSYILRIYVRFGNNPGIKSKELDREEKHLLAKMRYGFNMEIEESSLEPYRLRERFPIIYEDPIVREDWCKASELPIYDAYGIPYCEGDVYNSPPVITLLGDAVVTIGEADSYVEPGATAYDEEDGDITSGIVITGVIPTNGNRYIPGIYTLTYRVTDSRGLSDQVTREIVVTENSHPVITLAPNAQGDVSPINIIQGNNYVEPGYTASDAEDGDLTASVIVDNGSLNLNTVGVYTIIYTVTDSGGKVGSVVRLINVTPDQAPVITLLPDHAGYTSPITIMTTPGMATSVFHALIPGATAMDSEDGDLTVDIIVDQYPDNLPGEHQVRYRVADSFGNITTIYRIVNILYEDVAPVITLLTDDAGDVSPITVTVRATAPISTIRAQIPGATAVDNEDGNLTSSIIVDNYPATNTEGEHQVRYRVTDSVGHTTTVYRTVTVVHAPPIAIDVNFSNPLNITKTASNAWGTIFRNDYTVTYPTNNYTVTITDNGFDTSIAGTYTGTYTVTDNTYGETDSVDVTMHVSAPNNGLMTLELLPSAMGGIDVSMDGNPGGGYTEPGWTATDPDLGDAHDLVVVDEGPIISTGYGIWSQVITYTLTTDNGTLIRTRNIEYMESL